jgi:hypothetical protein
MAGDIEPRHVWIKQGKCRIYVPVFPFDTQEDAERPFAARPEYTAEKVDSHGASVDKPGHD